MTDPAKSGSERIVDWAFRDRATGAITIAQRPNLALWLFLASTASAWLIDRSSASRGAFVDWLRIAAAFSLAWWAVDEVLRGVNPWRRFLGIAALVWLGARLVIACAA